MTNSGMFDEYEDDTSAEMLEAIRDTLEEIRELAEEIRDAVVGEDEEAED